MTTSLRQKRGVIRKRIYAITATTLEHESGALGGEWVDELAEELGIDREVVVQEALKISAALRNRAEGPNRGR